MVDYIPKRGDFIRLNFDPQTGHEQMGSRPALVLSHTSFNRKIGFVFVRRGITLEACSSWFLPRLCNFNKAAEWAYTGKIFNAQEALAGGLVAEVLSPDVLMERAQQIAQDIVANASAVSVALNRQLMWKMLGTDHPIEAHKIDSKKSSHELHKS